MSYDFYVAGMPLTEQNFLNMANGNAGWFADLLGVELGRRFYGDDLDTLEASLAAAQEHVLHHPESVDTCPVTIMGGDMTVLEYVQMRLNKMLDIVRLAKEEDVPVNWF